MSAPALPGLSGVTVRAPRHADGLPGVPPRWVALPESVEEIAAVMRASAAHDLAVVPLGGGTKRHWGGRPSRCDVVIGTERLDEIVEHVAGDLVVRAQAGVTAETLAAALAAEGQELALDVPVPGTTVGGLLATGIAGPRRFRYGTPRDLIIGVTVVLADGTIARSGGKVVKNVAGYDLGKLFTGSYGTLGVIADATFRLRPLPAARAWVTADLTWMTAGPGAPGRSDRLAALVTAVAATTREPAAIELDWPGTDWPGLDRPGLDWPGTDRPGTDDGTPSLAVLIEGAAAAERARAVRDLIGNGALITDEPPAWWGRLPEPPGPSGGFLLEIRAAPSRLPGAVLDLMAAAGPAGAGAAVRGSIAAGVLHVALYAASAGAGLERMAGLLNRLRSRIEVAHAGGLDGRVVVLTSPEAMPPAVAPDPWGREATRRELLRRELTLRVKERFDPDHRMSPGRFAGGIR
ncbi:FAD-binding oxidoreductase [Sphaerimonospora sp. CA-214678]|uniref:FAD-binding oxidoreductase n=1 Tax=Sphaerimonospora sp. CA-214678 TaxID=3240029 RepID=UPI003D8A2EA9